MSATENFGLTYMTDGQAGAYLVFNEALLNIDTELYRAQNPLCYDDEVLVYEDNVLLWD